MTTSWPVRRLAPVLAALAALLGSVLLAAPASAADRVVTITTEGVTPKVLEVAAGDTVTFVNEGTRLDLVARSTSDNWSFSSELPILPGRSFTVPADQLEGPGTYTYAVGNDGEEPFAGSVVVPAPPSPRPAGSPASGGGAGPAGGGGGGSGGGPGGAGPGGPPPPGPGGGTGTAQPPVAGGFGPVPGPTTPLPGGLAPAPSIALPELPDEGSTGPAPETADEPEAAAGPLAVPGRLGAPAGYRGYGLPAALAAVLAAGVASLLVRLLLAEPAARRRVRGAVGGTPVATVD